MWAETNAGRPARCWDLLNRPIGPNTHARSIENHAENTHERYVITIWGLTYSELPL